MLIAYKLHRLFMRCCHCSERRFRRKKFFLKSILLAEKMLRVIAVVTSLAIVAVHSAPQLNDVELKEQAFNRINEAEYDYK